ncbi:hypothetical protein JCM9803A_10440 [Rhodococcus erythropolis]
MCFDRVESGILDFGVQLDVHPGFLDTAVAQGHQIARVIAFNRQDRMGELTDSHTLSVEHRGNGLDEQRHVVGDDLDGSAETLGS